MTGVQTCALPILAHYYCWRLPWQVIYRQLVACRDDFLEFFSSLLSLENCPGWHRWRDWSARTEMAIKESNLLGEALGIFGGSLKAAMRHRFKDVKLCRNPGAPQGSMQNDRV